MDHAVFKGKQTEIETEDRLAWLPSDHPQAAEIRGIAAGLKKWRNDVVGLVAAETGHDRIPVQLDRQIAERLSELQACGIDPAKDGIMDQLTSMRIAAGRQAVVQVIDHPMVQWVLNAKASRTRELIAMVKNVKTNTPSTERS